MNKNIFERTAYLSLFVLSLVLLTWQVYETNAQEADPCVGKPYPSEGCPVFDAEPETGTEPPINCGNNVVDENEECDKGGFNGVSECTDFCTLLSCGDGIVTGFIGEECEPEADRIYGTDAEGNLTIDTTFIDKTCGLRCIPPTCPEGGGPCTAGCTLEFLNACSEELTTEESATGTDATFPAAPEEDAAPESEPEVEATPTVPSVETTDTSSTESQPEDTTTPDTSETPSTVQDPLCGDGIVQSDHGENCDDGNRITNDVCPNDCTAAICGDAVREGEETCDDGNRFDYDRCRNTCQAPMCGDGIRDRGEECDDGNDDGTDLCTPNCMEMSCGDGYVQKKEECDDGNNEDADECLADCRIPVCGNGVIEALEACDDGNTESGDECTETCTVPFCGNGTQEGIEECDDGNTSDSDSCTARCTRPVCGDAVLEGWEECDAGVQNSNETAGACRLSCELPSCGDSVVDAGEECDGVEHCTDQCVMIPFFTRNRDALIIGSLSAFAALTGTLAVRSFRKRKLPVGPHIPLRQRLRSMFHKKSTASSDAGQMPLIMS